MRRRALLASLAIGSAGVAGCSFGSDSNGPRRQARQTEPTTGTARTATGQRPDEPPEPDERTQLIALETVSRTYCLQNTGFETDDHAEVVYWFDRTATADHPARITGWLRNPNDFENTFEIESIPAFGRSNTGRLSDAGVDGKLRAVPTEKNELATHSPEVTRNEHGLWYRSGVGARLPEYHRLAPGERIKLEYAVVGEREVSERATGTYTFTGFGSDETLSVTVWDTENPGPVETSRFAGRSVPEMDSMGEIQWYHEADETTRAFVRPSTERLELDGRVEFEMVNNSPERLECGHWDLYKLVDGEWFHLAPVSQTLECRRLGPGSRKQQSLRAFNGEPVPCTDDPHYANSLSRGYLGGGIYAVVPGYGLAANASGALVELLGEQVTVIPTDDASAEREGDTVIVTVDRSDAVPGSDPASLVLERTEGDAERVIAEQVMRPGWIANPAVGLRNALAAVEPSIERVVVRADDHVVDNALRHEPVRRIRFRGQAYELTRQEDA